MSLFAEAFLVPLVEAAERQPTWRYDEQQGLNVLADGSPFVETGAAAPTETLTEVRAEQDDFDRPDEDRVMSMDSTTKVRRQGGDLDRLVLLGTETRQAPGERDDFARTDATLGTETAIGGEADDFARAARDVCNVPARRAVTTTFVWGEADDFADKSADLPLQDRGRITRT